MKLRKMVYMNYSKNFFIELGNLRMQKNYNKMYIQYLNISGIVYDIIYYIISLDMYTIAYILYNHSIT